jgi:hypothetical protein
VAVATCPENWAPSVAGTAATAVDAAPPNTTSTAATAAIRHVPRLTIDANANGLEPVATRAACAHNHGDALVSAMRFRGSRSPRNPPTRPPRETGLSHRAGDEPGPCAQIGTGLVVHVGVGDTATTPGGPRCRGPPSRLSPLGKSGPPLLLSAPAEPKEHCDARLRALPKLPRVRRTSSTAEFAETSPSPRPLAVIAASTAARYWRDARQTSSTVPKTCICVGACTRRGRRDSICPEAAAWAPGIQLPT